MGAEYNDNERLLSSFSKKPRTKKVWGPEVDFSRIPNKVLPPDMSYLLKFPPSTKAVSQSKNYVFNTQIRGKQFFFSEIESY